MENPISIELDIYNACKTNTARALRNESKHYNLPFLVQISGARFEDLIGDLQRCAENKEDSLAIEAITDFAEDLLLAYEIQRNTY